MAFLQPREAKSIEDTAVTALESNVAELNALKVYRMCRSKTWTGSRYGRIAPTNPNRREGACSVFAANEQALRAEIDKNLKTPRVIFVSGSSGDGKSELFRRSHADYAKNVRFHLDETHSFAPQKDAIQTLDDQEVLNTCRRQIPMSHVHPTDCEFGPLVPRCKQNLTFVASPARPPYPLPL